MMGEDEDIAQIENTQKCASIKKQPRERLRGLYISLFTCFTVIVLAFSYIIFFTQDTSYGPNIGNCAKVRLEARLKQKDLPKGEVNAEIDCLENISQFR